MTGGAAKDDSGLEAAAGKATKKYFRMQTMRAPGTAIVVHDFVTYRTYVQNMMYI